MSIKSKFQGCDWTELKISLILDLQYEYSAIFPFSVGFLEEKEKQFSINTNRHIYGCTKKIWTNNVHELRNPRSVEVALHKSP